MDDEEDAPLFCPVARTYCDREDCEEGLCGREESAGAWIFVREGTSSEADGPWYFTED